MNPNYMKLAIELAKKGKGLVNPNPCVGAVIVKNNQVIGQGYHKGYGEEHAERNAFSNLKTDAADAEMYVTLEPCCHYGKQPPCTEAIIAHGIGTVYIGSSDPNNLVSGKGVSILRKHGIKVVENILKEQCDALNPIFFHYITTKRPYVALKYAMTLDGKIATHTGESKWITSEEARRHSHNLRHELSSIMVGIQTVLQDDPMLNCRLEGKSSPIRIVCDSHLRISLDSRIVKTAKKHPTYIATLKLDHSPALLRKQEQLTACGAHILETPSHDDRIDLPYLMQQLASKNIDSVLLEGGGTLNESFLRAGLVNHVYAYIAPKIFGGNGKFTPVGGQGVRFPDEAYLFAHERTTMLGEDVLLEYSART